MRSTVETQLASIPGAEPPEPGDDQPAYVFVRRTGSPKQDQDVIVGQATIAGQALTVDQLHQTRGRSAGACRRGMR